MKQPSIIDQLSLTQTAKKLVADIAESENRPEVEVVAGMIEDSLAGENHIIEAAREGDADAQKGGAGSSHEEVLLYLGEIASGNHTAQKPERNISY